jgi:hypothetical protein
MKPRSKTKFWSNDDAQMQQPADDAAAAGPAATYEALKAQRKEAGGKKDG